MGRRMWVWFILLFLVSGLLLTVSCAQKAVQPEPAISDSETEMIAQKAVEKARQEREAKQRVIEEEQLRQRERIRVERAEAAAAAERRAKAAARKMFQNEDVFFDFDSSILKAEAEDVLKRKAGWLRNNPGVSAIIEGHCDERGTNEYNLALGDRRAESAKLYLINLGIDAFRLTSISYGEERPIDPGQDEDAWAKNRRAHSVID